MYGGDKISNGMFCAGYLEVNIIHFGLDFFWVLFKILQMFNPSYIEVFCRM